MKVNKKRLAELEMVYAVCTMELNGKTHFLAATEEHGKCLLFSGPDWQESTVWQGPGGSMTLLPLKHCQGALLAIQEFFPIFKSQNAGIVLAQVGSCPSEPWRVRRVLDLPFVHRIEVVDVGNTPYIVAATLCGPKSYVDDWSRPGAVYAGPVPGKLEDDWYVEKILDGITKNHGLHITKLDDRSVGLVSGQEGLFALEIPQAPGQVWQSKRLLDHEVSDICAADIDGDGETEIAAIEPFHGNTLVVYKARSTGVERLCEYPLDFGHVVWMGSILSAPAIVAGSRGGKKELVLLRLRSSKAQLWLDPIILDRGVGATQIAVVSRPDGDFILSANHGANEVALYEITE